MILNVGKKATRIFLSALAAASFLACSKGTNSPQANLLTAPTQPRAEALQQLSVRVTSTSPFLTGVLLHSNSPFHHPGLSSTFQIDPTKRSEQLIGLLYPTADNFRASVSTRSGERIECNQVPQSGLMTAHSTLTLTFSCRSENVTLMLTRQPVAMERIAAEQTLQALRSQATLMLRDKLETVEITVLNDKLIFNSSAQLTSYPLSAAEHGKIISGQSRVILNNATAQCLQTLCNTVPGSLALRLGTAGELLLETISATGETLKTFAHRPNRSLRVASYNVENFWDDLPHNSSAYDDYSDQFSNWHSGGFAEKKARRIRAALIAAGLPEVVALQEIESAANQSRSLELLKLFLSELGYNHYALGQQAQDNPTAVTTAVISKFPLAENTRIDFLFKPDELKEDEQKDFIGASRDPQRVSVVLPEGIVFTLLNSHWKSKRDKSPWGDVMRRSLAELMRVHIETLRTAEGKPASAIIVGDFNADYREVPVYAGLQLVQSLAEARTDQPAHKLVPLWLTLSAQQQGDYPHDSHFQALDNIIITRSLLQDGPLALGAALQVVGRSGFAASVLGNGDGLPLRSQLRKYKDSAGQMRTTHFDLGFSDHLPIVAHFDRVLAGSSRPATVLFAQSIETQKLSDLPQVEIEGALCAANLEPKPLSSLASVQPGECVALTQIALEMQKTGLHHIYVQPTGNAENAQPQEKIVITADRAFGANKSWLRGTLQSSAGKTLTAVRGRVGYVEGYKAIFIHSPETDIRFE
ncbi:MAG: hypothetical protein RI932_575 [Pseudomonadota bacterium]|jgi:endonuclease/exonuclease/phosphatase family metal-dependent hydrolase